MSVSLQAILPFYASRARPLSPRAHVRALVVVGGGQVEANGKRDTLTQAVYSLVSHVKTANRGGRRLFLFKTDFLHNLKATCVQLFAQLAITLDHFSSTPLCCDFVTIYFVIPAVSKDKCGTPSLLVPGGPSHQRWPQWPN